MKVKSVNLIKWTLVVLSLFLVMISSAIAQDEKVKYATSNLNVRQSPSTESTIIAVIPKSSGVVILDDCNCEWVAVMYNGNVGYASSKYLSLYRSSSYSRASSVSGTRYYTNTNGVRVQSPTYYNSTPSGASARCNDGTYSFSRNRRGTCSGHGGVARWL